MRRFRGDSWLGADARHYCTAWKAAASTAKGSSTRQRQQGWEAVLLRRLLCTPVTSKHVHELVEMQINKTKESGMISMI